MELVIDTNIVFAAMVKNSVSRHLLLNSNLILYSPEGLISELIRTAKLFNIGVRELAEM